MIILQSNGQQAEKEGRIEMQKFEYLENEKRFLDKIKSIFHSFRRAIIGEKTKFDENSGHKLQNIFSSI